MEIKAEERRAWLEYNARLYCEKDLCICEVGLLLQGINRGACVPPLPETEVDQVAQEVCVKYAQNKDVWVVRWPKEVDAKTDEVEINKKGGKQARLNARYDLVCPFAMRRLAEVLHPGAERYGVDNWKRINVDSHLNHALYHIYRYLDCAEAPNGKEEDHLAHAFCRLMMAVSQKG